jgi:hypothetical protein
MDPDGSSSTSVASDTTDLPAVNSARVLLWAKQHGPLAAIALYVLYDGGFLLSLMGTVC